MNEVRTIKELFKHQNSYYIDITKERKLLIDKYDNMLIYSFIKDGIQIKGSIHCNSYNQFRFNTDQYKNKLL